MAAYAKKHLLAGQTLDMLADMRSQFASMLADARFVAPPAGGGRGRGPSPKGFSWADDPAAAWNRHASQPAVVRPLCMLQAHDVPDSKGVCTYSGVSCAHGWGGRPHLHNLLQPGAPLPASRDLKCFASCVYDTAVMKR